MHHYHQGSDLIMVAPPVLTEIEWKAAVVVSVIVSAVTVGAIILLEE